MANIQVIEMKAKQVSEVADKLKRAQSVVFFDYRGLTVEEVTALRADMRKAGVEYIVIKNSMVERAAREAGVPGRPAGEVRRGREVGRRLGDVLRHVGRFPRLHERRR